MSKGIIAQQILTTYVKLVDELNNRLFSCVGVRYFEVYNFTIFEEKKHLMAESISFSYEESIVNLIK